MKVNRVFCYSKEVARQNGNKLPILALLLSTILGMIVFISFDVIMEDNFKTALFVLFFITWLSLIIYYSVILGLRLRNRMIGYATDTEGRIFRATAMNKGQGLYFGGLAAGEMLDQLVGSDSNLGRNLGGAAGATAQLYLMNKSAKYMSHPEIVAKMVESAPNITGAEVIEILKVYLITNRKKSIKVKCDYKILRKNKIKYSKNLVIEKSFNMFEDLLNVLSTHK